MTVSTQESPDRRSFTEWLFGPRCVHDWQLLDKTVFKSDVEIAAAGRGRVSGFCAPAKVVLSFTCRKCGRLEVVTREQ